MLTQTPRCEISSHALILVTPLAPSQDWVSSDPAPDSTWCSRAARKDCQIPSDHDIDHRLALSVGARATARVFVRVAPNAAPSGDPVRSPTLAVPTLDVSRCWPRRPAEVPDVVQHLMEDLWRVSVPARGPRRRFWMGPRAIGQRRIACEPLVSQVSGSFSKGLLG